LATHHLLNGFGLLHARHVVGEGVEGLELCRFVQAALEMHSGLCISLSRRPLLIENVEVGLIVIEVIAHVLLGWGFFQLLILQLRLLQQLFLNRLLKLRPLHGVILSVLLFFGRTIQDIGELTVRHFSAEILIGLRIGVGGVIVVTVGSIRVD
jgi:hypothetical protein